MRVSIARPHSLTRKERTRMPKPYYPRHPVNWFVKRPAYIQFMLRELTAVFVGGYLIFLLLWLNKLRLGQEAFIGFLGLLKHPLSIILHTVALIAALWHSITWFNLTPKVMPLFIGETRVPGALLAFGMGYLPWIVITLLILWRIWP